MTLFTLRHRKGNHGVVLSFIQVKEPTGDVAKDMRIAEEIGQAYCNSQINCKYIRIEPAILADESVVDATLLDSIKNPKPRKKSVDVPAPKRISLEDVPGAKATGDNDLGDDREIAEELRQEEEAARVAAAKGNEDDADADDDDEDEDADEESDDVEEKVVEKPKPVKPAAKPKADTKKKR